MHRSGLILRLALIVLAVSLAGPVACGQRGPLYLPGEGADEPPRGEPEATENEDDAETP